MPQNKKVKTVAYQRIEQIQNKLSKPFGESNEPGSRFDMRYQSNIWEIDNQM